MADKTAADNLRDDFDEKDIADRGHARVPVSFPMKFMPVSKEEFRELAAEFNSKPTRERPEGVQAVAEQPSPSPGQETVADSIMAALERIEEKLDRLLDPSYTKGAEARETTYESGHCLDLSGSGLRFTSNWPLSDGWYVKVVIQTPEPHPVIVVALARVVRSRKGEGSNVYQTAALFEAIHEEDREHIIAYIFQRQRELAQLRRQEN
ncbi:MAG: PilZ domain-containing protein [bacterium]